MLLRTAQIGEKMTVELISVGTEILMGNIVNTNAAYLSAGCAQLGLSMYNQQVVGDNPERLAKAIEEALSRADIIIISGGLGPTEDDLTKETAAGVLGMKLIEDEHTKKRIKEMLQNSIFKNDIPDNNWKQAMVPEGAVVIDNSNGTAPGLIMEKDGKSVILLPGPPNELEPMFDNDIRPYLAGKNPDAIFSKMVKICGVGESQVETKLLDLIDAQTNPTIATYAKTGEVQVRVTAKAASESAAKELVKPVVKEIKSRFKENVYSVDANETLEEVVVKMLAKKDLKLVTVESCTGGLLAGRIVNVSGASEVFSQGLVTYSNKSKRKVLNVDKAVLKKYGAVSKETAKEMAKGGILASDAEVGVSVTGVAGPYQSEDKPVGLVYIGCYYKDKVTVKEYMFRGNRQKIREQAVVKALDLVRRRILEDD